MGFAKNVLISVTRF